MYRRCIDPATGGPCSQRIERLADGAIIPRDRANADWRDFLAWRAQGGAPQPAEALRASLPDIALWRLQALLERRGAFTAVDRAVTRSADAALQMLWRMGDTIGRRSGFASFLRRTLELTDAELDALFEDGAILDVAAPLTEKTPDALTV